MREGIEYLSFTDRGAALAEKLRTKLGGEAVRCGGEITLHGWTKTAFPTKRALVYVGAVGIAVRAIGPYIQDKNTDPAVVAVDQLGRFAVPLLSGHLGGANDLARAIAEITGGTAVITTATDLGGLWAADDWARRQDCAVVNPSQIKRVSGALLAGGTVRVRSAFPLHGTPPEGVELLTLPEAAGPPDGVIPAESDAVPDVWVDVRCPADWDPLGDGESVVEQGPVRDCGNREGPPLYITPRVLILGIGCRRGTAAEVLENRFASLCRTAGLWPEAFRAAATIDRKASEPGLLAFCERRDWPLYAFPAAELGRVPGTFTESAFVADTVGVGNVCERAAVLGAESRTHGGSTLLVRKYAGEGVTLAVARCAVRLDWS